MGNSFKGSASSGAGHDASGVAMPPQSVSCDKDFTLGKQLGSGAYSVVFLGKHKVRTPSASVAVGSSIIIVFIFIIATAFRLTHLIVLIKPTTSTAQKTGESVAVKKIRKSNLQAHDHTQLKDEVQLLQACRCKSIISFKAFYDEPEYYFVVTEVVAGGELFDRVSSFS